MNTENRVVWDCGAAGCSKGRHYGTVVNIGHAEAVAKGLTADPPGEVAVAFDDRPGVLQYHSRAELETLGSVDVP